ncbi:MAG: tetratricopeptide repeat protein [Promethearchaeota archaeon]
MEENDVLIKKAKELKIQGKYHESLKILEDLYKNSPHFNRIEKVLIETLFSYGGYLNDEYVLEYKKAKEIFKRIIEIKPNNYRAHYNLGIAYFNLGKLEKAKKAYEVALKIKPEYKHCYYNMGLIYETIGDFEHALLQYEKALKIDPNFTYALQARNDIRNLIDDLKLQSSE